MKREGSFGNRLPFVDDEVCLASDHQRGVASTRCLALEGISSPLWIRRPEHGAKVPKAQNGNPGSEDEFREAQLGFSPLQSSILEAEIQTAARVAKLVFDSKLARVERPTDMVAFIRRHVYKPEYTPVTVPKDKAA